MSPYKINYIPRRNLLLILLFAACMPGYAQDNAALQSVDTRPRPDFDPRGTRMGIFDVDASLDMAIGYSDNVLAASTNEFEDLLAVFDPAVRLNADLPRSNLSIAATMSIGRYDDYSTEDYDDYSFQIDWRRRLGADTLIRASGGTVDGHESRREPTDEDSIRPARFQRDFISAGVAGTSGAFGFDLSVEARDIDYEDAEARIEVINNDDRNRRENRLRLQLELNPQRNLSPLVEISVDERDYEQPIDDFGFARSSNGYEVGIGFRARDIGNLNGEIVLGRISRDYDSGQFTDRNDFWARTNLEWKLSGLTTIALDYETRIDETNYGEVSGINVDEAGLELDHELLRSLLVSLGARYARKDYDSSVRKDDVSVWYGRAKYFINNHLHVSFEFESNDRDSTVPQERFDENIFRIVLRTAL